MSWSQSLLFKQEVDGLWEFDEIVTHLLVLYVTEIRVFRS